MIRKMLAGLLLATVAATAALPVAASGPNIVERLAGLNDQTSRFDTLMAAATCEAFRSDVDDPLSSAVVSALATTPDLTLFAPTDTAFRKAGLSAANVCSLAALPPTAEKPLLSILLYHVADPGFAVAPIPYATAVAASPVSVPTLLAGESLDVSAFGNSLRVDGNRVIKRDLMASNGIIHVVDGVLLP